MKLTKTVELNYRLRRMRPPWRDLGELEGAAALEAAEAAALAALAGNGDAIEAFFSALAGQARAGRKVFGPFLFAGGTGTGKTALIRALLPKRRPELFVSVDLSTCRAAHDISSLLGSGYGYTGDEPEFSKQLRRLNEGLAVFDGHPLDTPLPVICFDHADEAHPEVLAGLHALLTEGVFKPLKYPALQLTRAALILTVGGVAVGPAGQPREEAEAELGRALRGLKTAQGQPILKPGLLERATVVPFREAGPEELAAFLATEIGGALGWAYGSYSDGRSESGDPNPVYEPSGKPAPGRLRLSPLVLERLWEEAARGLPATASARHLLEAVRGAWKNHASTMMGLVRHHSEALSAPGEGRFYLAHPDAERKTVTFEPWAFETPCGMRAALPLPYLERCWGPDAVLRGDYWELPDDFEERLNRVLSGQRALIRTLTGKLRARLTEKGAKPMLSFIVLGPTGTGKTALGRALAATAGRPLVLCDCNTWQTREAVLTGIFGRDPTSVASRLREEPASVVVFDEVDKADPKFWEIFMGVGDTGQIVDSETGHTVSLRHAVLELTSNYLADQLGGLADQAREKSGEEMDPLIRKALSVCAQINPACLERLDLAGLMLPLAGEDAYPMWTKFVAEKLDAMACPLAPTPEVAAYLEHRHADLGAGAGARARQRACADLLEKWKLGGTADFEAADGALGLSPAARAWLAANPAPRSERQRYWRVTPEREARLRTLYKGNDELLDDLLALLRVEALKTRPRGPVAVIFAVGPTGRGKSWLGKALADAFGKEQAVELACSQCKDEHVVSPFLFSAPASYKGAELGGQLTNPLLTRKDRVIVFDEIEKAHPSMLDQMLNVLDEGRATDLGKQLPVDLKQCVILLTGNLAADRLQAALNRLEGRPFAEKQAAAREILAEERTFAPEKLARFQRIYPVAYAPAGAGDDTDVAAALQSVLDEFDLGGLRVRPEALRALSRECRSAGLKDVRAMRNAIQTRLAAALLEGRGNGYAVADGELRTEDGGSSRASNPPSASASPLNSE